METTTNKTNSAKMRVPEAEKQSKSGRREIDEALDMLRGVAAVSLSRSSVRYEKLRVAWRATPRTTDRP